MNQKPHSLEHSFLLGDGRVFHYTCNPPPQKVLDHYNIITIGNEYGCSDPREVLLIPIGVFEQEGIPIPQDTNILKINAENLLRRLK